MELRPATLKVFNGISAHWAEEGKAPSLRELRKRLGLTLNPLRYHIDILEQKGYLRARKHAASRDLYPTNKPISA